MTFVTVFRHVPRPIIGMIGVRYDRPSDRSTASSSARRETLTGPATSLAAMRTGAALPMTADRAQKHGNFSGALTNKSTVVRVAYISIRRFPAGDKGCPRRTICHASTTVPSPAVTAIVDGR